MKTQDRLQACAALKHTRAGKETADWLLYPYKSLNLDSLFCITELPFVIVPTLKWEHISSISTEALYVSCIFRQYQKPFIGRETQKTTYSRKVG